MPIHMLWGSSSRTAVNKMNPGVKQLVNTRGQRRMTWLVGADGKAAGTQITTLHLSWASPQNSTSGCSAGRQEQEADLTNSPIWTFEDRNKTRIVFLFLFFSYSSDLFQAVGYIHIRHSHSNIYLWHNNAGCNLNVNLSFEVKKTKIWTKGKRKLLCLDDFTTFFLLQVNSGYTKHSSFLPHVVILFSARCQSQCEHLPIQIFLKF